MAEINVSRETANLKKILYKTIENKKSFGKKESDEILNKNINICTIRPIDGEYNIKIHIDIGGSNGGCGADIYAHKGYISIKEGYRAASCPIETIKVISDYNEDRDNPENTYLNLYANFKQSDDYGENSYITSIKTYSEVISGLLDFSNIWNSAEIDNENITSDETIYFDDKYYGTEDYIPVSHMSVLQNDKMFVHSSMGIGGGSNIGYLNIYGKGLREGNVTSRDVIELYGISGGEKTTDEYTSGRIEIRNADIDPKTTIYLNGKTGDIISTGGVIQLCNKDTDKINAKLTSDGTLDLNKTSSQPTIRLRADESNDGIEGYIGIYSSKDEERPQVSLLNFSESNAADRGAMFFYYNDDDGMHTTISLNERDFGSIILRDIEGSGNIKLNAKKVNSGTSQKVLCINHDDNDDSAYAYITNNGDAGFNGTVTATQFNATSDRRLKTNIEDFIPSKSILDLPIKSFDYITTNKHAVGCIAQDLQEICPEIVDTDNSGYLSIQESKIVYLLLDELKKVRKEFDEYREKTTERYDMLLSRIEKLEKGE